MLKESSLAYIKRRFRKTKIFHCILSNQIREVIIGYRHWFWVMMCLTKEVYFVFNEFNGKMTRPAWDLISSLEPFKKYPSSSISVACKMVKKVLNIPSGAGLL